MPTPLQAGGSVVLATVAGVVTGRISLGPDSQRGPAYWDVDTVLYKTSRPGVAPIPRIELFLDDAGSFAQAQFLSYDGSFGNAGGQCRVGRGQLLVAVWTGGTAGDTAFLTLTGTKG
jgi:hypothetical protein